jgi:hypothetical protein
MPTTTHHNNKNNNKNNKTRNPLHRSSQWGKTATRIQLEPFVEPSTSTSPSQPLRRLVIFAGPHKSASTSIQKFFTQHAGNQHLHSIHPSFQDWIWPYEPFGQHPGSYNDFVVKANDLRRAELYFTISFVWDHHNPKITTNYEDDHEDDDDYDAGNATTATTTKLMRGKNVFLGSEELDRIPGQTPWSGRNGIRALDNIVRLLSTTTEAPPEQLDIVINYRTPRVAHWISIWKQLTQSESGASSYEALVGQSIKTYEHLNSVANPLALAYEIRNRHRKNRQDQRRRRRRRSTSSSSSMLSLWNVTLIDMGGVDKAGLDISHVIACQVLQVPCTKNGHVQGLEHKHLHSNRREADPGLTVEQLDELEWLFRQRDCAYAQDLVSDPGVTVLFRDSLWEESQKEQHLQQQQQPPEPHHKKEPQPQQMQSGGEYYCDQYDPELQQTLRHNGTLFLYLVQAQVLLGPGAGRPEYNISTLRDESLLRHMKATTNETIGSTLSSSPWWKIGGPHSIDTTATATTTRTSRTVVAPMDSQALTFPVSSVTLLEYRLTYIGIFQNVALVVALIVTLYHIGVRRRRRR